MRVRRCRFEVIAGPDQGLVRDIEALEIRVGARRSNDVQLSDAKVSGLHFEVCLDADGYRLRDLDSTNGTFVGGYRINDIYIPPGTVIGAGSSKLRFDPLGESVEIALSVRDRFGGMIGRSVKMRELFARLDKLAKSDTTVLITGETGVGKELVAESLHEYSDRNAGPFEVLDCGSIPQNLIESQLFGHERGAFTGATNSFAGVFERADKGTVFLDEIGELPLAMQPKLLRVLERHEVRRIGATKTVPIDIRVVAATNRDLGVEVNRGRFREDLYYRLAVARIQVPPLRERRDDIPHLVEHILASIRGGESAFLAPETIDLMMKHDWPGNVRELRNVIERAVLLSEAPVSAAALKDRAAPGSGDDEHPGQLAPGREPGPDPGDVDSGGVPNRGEQDRGRRESESEKERKGFLSVAIDISRPFKAAKQHLITEFERRYIGQLLAAHDGNISQAARAAGIDRMSIHKMLNRLNLRNPRRQ